MLFSDICVLSDSNNFEKNRVGLKKSDIIAMLFVRCCCIFAETKPFYVMKTTKKQQKFRVSDRAYCKIISDVIDSMTGCRIDPFIFKQVVTAVSSYLKPEGKITGLCKKAKAIFDRLLPDLDLAIRRASTARAAAARRKVSSKKPADAVADESADLSKPACEKKPVAMSGIQREIFPVPDPSRREVINSGSGHKPAPRPIKSSDAVPPLL